MNRNQFVAEELVSKGVHAGAPLKLKVASNLSETPGGAMPSNCAGPSGSKVAPVKLTALLAKTEMATGAELTEPPGPDACAMSE